MKTTTIIIIISLLLACHQKNNIENTTRYRSMLENETEFTVIDSHGKKHVVQELTKAEFHRYEKRGIKPIDPFPEKEFKVYETKKGKIIAVGSGMYSLYPSLEVLKDVISESYKRTSEPLMYGKNPYGDKFPEHVDGLIATMLLDLHIPSKLKTDEAILKALDKVIVKKRTPAFFDKYYLSFIAFVGKMAIKRLGGEWVMLLSDDGVTWTPCLKINGQDLCFLDYIEIDVDNLNLKTPLEETFESVVAVAASR